MRRSICLFLVLLLAGCGEDGGTGVERGDTIPPAAVQSLTVHRTADDSVTLRWAAPGDDQLVGQASHYEVRYGQEALTEANWESATLIPDPPTPRPSGITDELRVDGLLRGRWYFALKAADEELNWSPLSNVASAEMGDTIPPAMVSDLAVFAFDESSVSLTWTAPGDDGNQRRAAAYDLRHASTPLSEPVWNAATKIEAVPAPGSPGTREMFQVEGLTTGRDYYFALRTIDDGGNLSSISNVVVVTTTSDTIPPSQIADLEVTWATGRTAHLRWTAPGDNDDQGQADEYDLRYSDAPITDETWTHATKATGLSLPAPAGAAESVTIGGLQLDSEYHFALRTADAAGNWSALSNPTSAQTTSLVIYPHGLRGARDPDWEPNGARIAFAGLGDRTNIHLLSVDDAASVQLTDHEESVWAPRWSPDGATLAVVVLRSFFPYADPGIGLMEPIEGADPITISPHGRGAGVSAPSWSPDGTRIVYSASTGMSQPSAILVVDANGGTPDTLFADGSVNVYPDWSPNGDLIAFGSNVSGNFDLWTLPITGGTPTQITHNPSRETSPKWSPDGSRIAFVSDLQSTGDIWMMPAGGGDWIRVTAGPFTAGDPCWSPTGDAIAFTKRDERNNTNIAIQYLP